MRSERSLRFGYRWYLPVAYTLVVIVYANVCVHLCVRSFLCVCVFFFSDHGAGFTTMRHRFGENVRRQRRRRRRSRRRRSVWRNGPRTRPHIRHKPCMMFVRTARDFRETRGAHKTRSVPAHPNAFVCVEEHCMGGGALYVCVEEQVMCVRPKRGSRMRTSAPIARLFPQNVTFQRLLLPHWHFL